MTWLTLPWLYWFWPTICIIYIYVCIYEWILYFKFYTLKSAKIHLQNPTVLYNYNRKYNDSVYRSFINWIKTQNWCTYFIHNLLSFCRFFFFSFFFFCWKSMSPSCSDQTELSATLHYLIQTSLEDLNTPTKVNFWLNQ